MAAVAKLERVVARVAPAAKTDIDQLDDLDFDDVPELLETLKEHEMVKNAMRIIAEGNLEEYSNEARSQIKALEADSLHEYMDVGRTQSVIALHKEVTSTDSQLANMNDLLQSFQREMASLSEQIQTLLDASVSMKAKLQNREEVEVALHNITHHVTIDEELIEAVCNAPVGETYVKYLVRLDKISSWIKSTKLISNDDVRAISEVEPLVARLQTVAVERMREFLLTKINSLQRPNTNMPIIQQTFLRYKKFFEVLMEYNVDVGVEVKNKYVEIVHSILNSQFKTYISGLARFKPDDATRFDLLGNVDSARSRSAGLFALGDRVNLVADMISQHKPSSAPPTPSVDAVPATKTQPSLSQSMSSSSSNSSNSSNRPTGLVRSTSQTGPISLDSPASHHHPASATPPHLGPNPIILASGAENKKYNFEWIFHSMELVLLDTVCSEVLFEREFFSFDLFKQLFPNVLSTAEEMLDSYLNNTYDCVAILLMLIIVERDVKVMSYRDVACLDPYLARCTNKLLSRILQLIDSNVQSLKQARPQDMVTTFDIRPHVVTRRYAELIVAVNILCGKMDNQINASRITNKMKLLCAQMKDLLLRIAALETDEMKRSAFLINNYDLILSVIKERSIESASEAAEFGEMFDIEVINFVESELSVHFGKLISFVKKKTQDPNFKVSAEIVVQLIQSFGTQWKGLLKKISDDVMVCFSNFTTGGRILQKSFAQLVLYYKRFEDLVKTHYKDLYSRVNAEFVAISAMTYEMKQFTAVFNY